MVSREAGIEGSETANTGTDEQERHTEATCGVKGKYQVVVSDKKWKTLKQGLKLFTKKTAPETISERIAKLKAFYRGWINYFRMASMQSKLKELDGWLRNRLRYRIWEDWKKPERRRKNLMRLGISKGQAYAWSRTRMGRLGCCAESYSRNNDYG